MSANQPSIAETPDGTGSARRPDKLKKIRWAIWAVALLGGVGIGAAIHLLKGNGSKATSNSATAVQLWAAGAKKAPAFSLVDQNGKTVSLAGLRGRPVLLSFIDPFCRNFCPREASVLSSAAEQLGTVRPAVVAVSVDPWADSAKNFHQDALHWNLVPGWRWATGTQAGLSSVWKSYDVGVLVTKKTVAGITVRYITHTGAAYLIDASGHERALFLYPFKVSDVVGAAKTALGSGA